MSLDGKGLRSSETIMDFLQCELGFKLKCLQKLRLDLQFSVNTTIMFSINYNITHSIGSFFENKAACMGI